MPTALLLSLALAAPMTATATAGGVTKLDSPPKPEWVAVQADPVLTTLSVDKAAKWVLVDDGPTCDLRPAPDGKTAAFAAKAAGQYRVLVIAGEDLHRVKIVVADAPQPMPPTPPDPGPKPPVPPPPPLPLPPPADPLVRVFQSGYDADARAKADKENDRLDLIELYRQAADLANDAKIETAAALITQVRKAADALKIAGLLDVRKAVATELAAAFPADGPLTADARKKAGDLFLRFKAALEQVK